MDIDAITSYTCNLNCDHCSVKDFLDSRKVDYDKIKLPNNIRSFRIGGGEPLINNLDGLYRFICRYPYIDFKITTNLIYPLTEQRMRILKKIKHPMTSFDIGGIRFKNVRNLSLWYHNAKKLIQEKGNHVGIFVCIHNKFDESKVEPLVKLFDKIRFADCVFIPVINYGNAKRNRLVPSKEKVDNVLKTVLSIKDKYRIRQETIKLLEYKNYSGCYYDPIKPFSPDNRVSCLCIDKETKNPIYKRCLFDIENNCTGFGCALECVTCEKYIDMKCAGHCTYSKCYYKEEIMDKV